MKNENNDIDRHLTDDEILVALVDEADLGPELQAHLSACQRCKSKLKKIDQQLHDLGHMAEHMAPVSTRRIRLPETIDRSDFQSGWRLKPVLGLMAAMVLVVMLVWPQANFYIQTYFIQNMLTQGIKEDNILISKVDVLVEDALPEKYRHILSVAEPEFDQDFMQYIVPAIEDNNFSSLSNSNRGAAT
jgi:hypothetical protein